MPDVDGSLARLSMLKAFLGITNTTNDALLKQYLKAATQAFQTECARNFISQTYTDEVYTAQRDQKRLYLRQWPVTNLAAIYYGETVKTVSDFDLINSPSIPYLILDSGAPFPYVDSYIKRLGNC